MQDVLVDAKVPRFARDRVPVLCTGSGPVAVVGLTLPPGTRRRATVVVDVDALDAGAFRWTTAVSRTS